MHQSILVDADVDKCAELGDIGDHAFQHHARLDIRNLPHLVAEAGRDKLVSRIASGLLQLGQNVVDGIGAGRELFAVHLFKQLWLLDKLPDRRVKKPRNLFHHRIGLGMDGGHVQRVVAVANAQKPRRLLEGFGSDAGHFQHLRAGAEAALLVAKGHDVQRGALGDAGDKAQQRPGGSVQIHAHLVDAAFDHGLERFLKLALVHIVLILADADGLRIDLDQL